MSTKKYRPYLTLVELETIHNCLTEGQFKQIKGSRELNRYIEKYISDIRAGFRSANHTLQPTIEEKLGFSDLVVEDESLLCNKTFTDMLSEEEAKLFTQLERPTK